MSEVPVLTAFLACAVPLAALFVVFKSTIAAAWNGPLARRLRNSHWTVQVAALFAVALVTAHGGSKGDGGTNTLVLTSGGTNTLVVVSGGETNAVAASTSATNSLESATVDAQAIAAMVDDLQDAELAPPGPDRDGDEAAALLDGWISLPPWYHYDPTDTDLDGVPDLWEIWTRSDPFQNDSGIDRDGDALSDGPEFYHQTDPRTADTDADGFSDGVEVDSEMDPLVKADFTPVEPDGDNNGVIDLWEGSGLLYGFQDANSDGFDDTYATTLLPAASDANFDVLVDVWTSRSAALTWEGTNGSGGIVLLATAGTTVRLRLPFGADTALRFLPAPEGTDPPVGQLWKSRLRLSFAPRAGQTLAGFCIVASDGAIAQKSVVREAAIVCFPQSDADDPESPQISLFYRRIGITPTIAAWHFVGELVGPFAVTNFAGAMPQSVSWSAEYGTVSAAPDGATAFLTVTSAPPPYETVAISAASELDGSTCVTNRLPVPRCTPRDFELVGATGNFSPHLGETASFTFALPGCEHYRQPGWLEGDVVRETTTGWQHVGWLDMDPAQPGFQKRRHCLVSPQTVVWSGIATEGAALAESPEVFTGGTVPFHRALPEVVTGEPVPPPYYTLRFTYRDEDRDDAAVIGEADATVRVPQVVKVEMTDAAFAEFNAPIVYPDTYWPEHVGNPDVNNGISVAVYDGCDNLTKDQVLDKVVEGCGALVPPDVNLRFTRGPATGRYKHAQIVTVVDIMMNYVGAGGFTPPQHVSWRNENPYGVCYVYADGIRRNPCEERLRTETDIQPSDMYDPALFPFTPDELATAMASTAVHETGHTHGLVNPILYGTKTSHNQTTLHNGWIMNRKKPAMQRFGKTASPQLSWKPRNHDYLHFALPHTMGGEQP